jgi:peptidyl-prolyl cis-trans isomerase SurA
MVTPGRYVTGLEFGQRVLIVKEANAAMAQMTGIFVQCRRLVFSAALIMLASAAVTGAAAQQIVVVVNGDPITALDIEQRGKLMQLSGQKSPGRQQVLEELINEKLKVKEAKRYGLEVPDSEVDQSFAAMASRMRSTPDQLTQALSKAGIHVNTLKARIRADITWQQLVRGRYQSILQVGEKDLLATASTPDDSVGYDFTLRPILFFSPSGSDPKVIEGRKREAEALRARFTNCDEGIAFARALKDVAVRDQVTRSSADLPAELRKVLDGMEVGKLTPPEVTKFGVEMFAICRKRESAAENTPGRRKARESLMVERFEQQSKKYLREVRRSAMIEYK